MHSVASGDGDSIKVFVRVRPLSAESSEADVKVCLDVDKDRNAIIMRSKPDPKVFTFDEVVDQNTTQARNLQSLFSIQDC